MAAVTYDNASHTYRGAERPAVDALDLEIAEGELLVLVGPSGCGKSTSLRMLAGLEEITGGDVRIGTRSVAATPPRDRDIAMVFQSYALYPHMTVGENMGFALKMAGVSKDEIRTRVRDAAAMLDLGEMLDRKPRALSGGQRQRVAMARAIVREPQVFCMDEPLSNLDAKLRVQTRAQIATLQRRLGTTTLYVTHDQVEAMTMGDRVAVLRDGVLQQVDTPRAMYARPANAFVAGFIGSPAMNLLDLEPDDGAVRLGGTELRLPRGTGAVTVGVRPEDMETVPAGEGLALDVDLVEELGADAYAYGTAMVAGVRHPLVARVDGRRPPAKGDVLHLAPRPDHVHVFAGDTGERIDA